jgi:hypothetical protein
MEAEYLVDQQIRTLDKYLNEPPCKDGLRLHFFRFYPHSHEYLVVL